MPRYKLTLEYDGTPFVGWQMQDNGPSVQGALAASDQGLFRRGDHPARRRAHRCRRACLGQVAHFDLAKDWATDKVRDALNAQVRPDPISVLACERAADDFDARFSATARHYLYRIVNRRAPLALDRNRAWHVVHTLDAAAMHEAAQALVGHHDFTTFRSAECQAASPVKTLDRLAVTQTGDEIMIEASARSFLHNQVRSMVGSLKLVGEGKWAAADLKQAFHARNRGACGPVAPACGLYLMRVDY